ncbi:group II intron maturase-specific domain-containing protein [Lyngbya sp. CCY1209]|uniref:group II intron maturase-specific domain-containing protein n=1 Tax=Lyngbya sp. CCY1209 TaxID=2886103 RepID=UPI002D21762E|nr:group II intron maturase-specific domain-containing protein [Lyngbya sp. CCY1209]MEB3885866.1 reverse transcriptase N-terminal domain-containing protein [Lyngbya sp. CCY1209]
MNKTKARPNRTRMVCTDENLAGANLAPLRRRLWKLQQRIYRASKRGDVKAVRRLQKTLIRSATARYLASRVIVAADGPTQPIRECLMSWAIEPESRALSERDDGIVKAERSLSGAVRTIARTLEDEPQFVGVADLKFATQPGNFARGLTSLPRKLKLTPKAIAAPLVALLDAIANAQLADRLQAELGSEVDRMPRVIRWGTHLAIVHRDRAVVEACQEAIARWLKQRQLPSGVNCQITHSVDAVGGQRPGFEVSEFHVRQFPRGNGYRTAIAPSRDSVARHYRELAAIVESHKAGTQADLILSLNRAIRAWGDRFRIANCRSHHTRLDWLLDTKLKAWAKRRHPNKPADYRRRKYWQTTPDDRHQFGCFQNGKWAGLLKHGV